MGSPTDILCLNCGSSSLKSSIFTMHDEGESLHQQGAVEGIGLDTGRLKIRDGRSGALFESRDRRPCASSPSACRIGERAPTVRREICQGLAHLGIVSAVSDARVTSIDGRARVRVVPTNENLMIARQTWELLFGPAESR